VRHLTGVLGSQGLSGFMKDIGDLENRVFIEASTAEAEVRKNASQGLELVTSHMQGSRMQDSRRADILKWISEISFESHHRRISEARLDGTRE